MRFPVFAGWTGAVVIAALMLDMTGMNAFRYIFGAAFVLVMEWGLTRDRGQA